MISYPWSALCLLAYLYAIVAVYVMSLSRSSLKTLYSGKTCSITVAAATVMVLVFGFTGISRGVIYYAVMLALMGSMGLALAADIHHIRSRRLAPVMAHLGVFVVMAAGVFGYADKQSAKVTAYLGHPESVGMDAEGRRVDLPFMITLNSFDIERYPVRYSITAPDGTVTAAETSRDWKVTELEKIDMAVMKPGSDSWEELRHVGAEPASLVKVEGTDGRSVTGWVACGSFMFAPSFLELPDGSVLSMNTPAPQSYDSKVSVIDARGRKKSFEISVNHPARLGAWRIYQAGYDIKKGRWSEYSVLQCVRDPWYPAIAAGLWIILASAVVMMFTAGRGRKNEK